MKWMRRQERGRSWPRSMINSRRASKPRICWTLRRFYRGTIRRGRLEMADHTTYCAGPMFSTEDNNALQKTADALEVTKKFGAYLPFRDGLEIGAIMNLLRGPLIRIPEVQDALECVLRMVFAIDMYQLLVRCDSVVFNMDGRVPDDGSVSETAAAFAAGKGIVIYKTSPITMLANRDNPMVQGLSYTWRYVDDISKIPSELQAIISLVQREGHGDRSSYRPPSQVAKVTAAGEVLWKVLTFLKDQGVREGAVGRAARGPVEKPEELPAVIEPFT